MVSPPARPPAAGPTRPLRPRARGRAWLRRLVLATSVLGATVVTTTALAGAWCLRDAGRTTRLVRALLRRAAPEARLTVAQVQWHFPWRLDVDGVRLQAPQASQAALAVDQVSVRLAPPTWSTLAARQVVIEELGLCGVDVWQDPGPEGLQAALAALVPPADAPPTPPAEAPVAPAPSAARGWQVVVRHVALRDVQVVARGDRGDRGDGHGNGQGLGNDAPGVSLAGLQADAALRLGGGSLAVEGLQVVAPTLLLQRADAPVVQLGPLQLRVPHAAVDQPCPPGPPDAPGQLEGASPPACIDVPAATLRGANLTLQAALQLQAAPHDAATTTAALQASLVGTTLPDNGALQALLPAGLPLHGSASWVLGAEAAWPNGEGMAAAQGWAALQLVLPPAGATPEAAPTPARAPQRSAAAAASPPTYAGVALTEAGVRATWRRGALAPLTLHLRSDLGVLDATLAATVRGTALVDYAFQASVDTLRPARLTTVPAAWRSQLPDHLALLATATGQQLWPAPRGQVTLRLATTAATAGAPSLWPLTARLLADVTAQASDVRLLQLRAGADQLVLTAAGHLAAANASADAAPHAEPLELHASLRGQRLAPLVARVAAPLRLETARVDVALRGSPRRPRGTLAVYLAGLAQAERPLGDVRLRAQLADGMLWLGPATLHGPRGDAHAAGFVALLDEAGQLRREAPLHLELNLGRLQLALSEQVGACLRGSALVGGTLTAPQFDSLWTATPGCRGAGASAAWWPQLVALAHGAGDVLQLRALGATFPSGGRVVADAELTPSTGAVRGALQARGVPLPTFGGADDAAGTRATPPPPPPPTTQPATAAAAAAAAWQAGASTPLGAPPAATLDAAAELSGSLQAPALQLALRAPMLRLDAAATVQAAAQTLDASLAAHADFAALGRCVPALAPLALAGDGVLHLAGQGPLAAPTLRGSFVGTRLNLMGQPVADGRLTVHLTTPTPRHWQVTLAAGAAPQADVNALRLGLQQLPRGRWQLQAEAESLRAASFWPPLRQLGAELCTSFSAQAAFGGDAPAQADGVLRALAAQSQGADLRLVAPVAVAVRHDRLSVAPFALRGSAGEVVGRATLGAQLDAQLRGQLYLRFAVPFVPAFNYADGALSLSVDAAGDVAAPTADVRLRVAEPVTLRLRTLPMALKVGRGEVVADRRQVVVRGVEGSIEGGTFRVGGEVALGGDGLPNRYDVQLVGEHLPLNLTPLLLETNVALALRGDGPVPHVVGQIDLLSGRLVKRLELRSLATAGRTPAPAAPMGERLPWLADMGLDVHVRSSSGLDIRVDAGSFALHTSLESDLRIGGNALVPRLSGKVQAQAAQAGSLRFPRGELHLRQAVVDFEPGRATPRNRLGTQLDLLAEGELGGDGGGSKAYDVAVRLGGALDAMDLALTSPQGLSRLEIISLLTTGRTLAELSSGGGGGDTNQLDAALAFAGSQLSEPLARFAQQKIEQALKLRLELGAEVAGGNVRVEAAKNVSRRFRLVGAYSHGLTAEQSHISTRAQLSLTDRLLVEGKAAHALTGATGNAAERTSSNLELKLRLFGH